MSEPFLAEIKVVSFNFPPKGWALCNGQFLPINQNQALFSLMGTMYGGNGQTNFALPNLRGRVPVHIGSQFVQGQAAGATAVTLTQSELPGHTHTLSAHAEGEVVTNLADSPAALPGPRALSNAQVGQAGGGTAPVNLYGAAENFTTMNAAIVTNAGGNQPHNNMMPYLVLNFIVALQGIFPSQN